MKYKTVLQILEQKLGLPKGGLDAKKDMIKAIIKVGILILWSEQEETIREYEQRAAKSKISPNSLNYIPSDFSSGIVCPSCHPHLRGGMKSQSITAAHICFSVMSSEVFLVQPIQVLICLGYFCRNVFCRHFKGSREHLEHT